MSGIFTNVENYQRKTATDLVLYVCRNKSDSSSAGTEFEHSHNTNNPVKPNSSGMLHFVTKS